MSSPIETRFRNALTRLASPAGRILIGYSGGADSTFLLHQAATAGFDVVAAHLHHGQREEADREQNLCQAFAESLGIAFVTGRADVPAIGRERRIGLEEAGREARYAFFRQAADRLECAWIATGHTATDHAETVLLHLTRGTGLAGLGGIPERADNLIRPLLGISRHDCRAYCDERGLWYHDDPANDDPRFARSRIRTRVIPELQAINPGVESAIARLAAIAAEEDGFLDAAAAAGLEHAEIPLNGDLRFVSLASEAAFDRSVLAHLPPVLLNRGVRLAMRALGAEIDFEQTRMVTAGLADAGKGSITAEGGRVVIEWDRDRLHVRELPAEPFRYPLTVPGETTSDVFGWKFVAEPAPDRTAPAQRRSLAVGLDAASLKGALYFRSAQVGDAMTPLGFDHSRKVADLLSEAKLTTNARASLPIVCDLVGPVWVPGVCLSARVATGQGPVIQIQFGPA